MKSRTCGKGNGVGDGEVIMTIAMTASVMEMTVVMAGKIATVGVMMTMAVRMGMLAVRTRVAGGQR